MSETSFPVNDLLRRKLQTSLVVVALALCVASTLFLLVFAGKIGLSVSFIVEGRLTAGFSTVFSPFVILVGILILGVGVVMISFMVFMMMSQRVRDIGLMKAAGCPSDLVFGYFLTELLIVAFVGCLLGVVLGVAGDSAVTSLFNSMGFRIPQEPIDVWFVLLVFAAFFILSLVVGIKPAFDAARVSPTKAMSPTYHFGLSKEHGFKVVSKSGFVFKIALRSLFRHSSASLRIILCLGIVFTLVTVGVAGGVIANQTTENWVEKAIGRDIAIIAHHDVCVNYQLLLSSFYEGEKRFQLNYTDQRYAISENLLNQLRFALGNTSVDARLIIEAQVNEVQGYTLGDSTQGTMLVGDSRTGLSLIVGVEPENVLSKWFLRGRFIGEVETFEAVIGDTLAHKMFSTPLVQKMKAFNASFDVVGVCVDPVNNGNVTYVPLRTLESVANVSRPNLVMVRIDRSTNGTLDRVKDLAAAADPEFEVVELNEMLDRSMGFVGSVWSTVMFLPVFSLIAATLCLLGYVMLAIDEQKQEFGIMRAVGANPKTVINIISGQSLLVLLSGYVLGVAFGTIITLIILVEEPFVTGLTVLEIAGWLLIALVTMFAVSLYPALRFARKPILDIMNQS